MLFFHVCFHPAPSSHRFTYLFTQKPTDSDGLQDGLRCHGAVQLARLPEMTIVVCQRGTGRGGAFGRFFSVENSWDEGNIEGMEDDGGYWRIMPFAIM